MDLRASLADELLRKHPREAARAIERLAAAEGAATLSRCEPAVAAEVLSRLTSISAGPILALMKTARLADAVAQLPPDRAARLSRRLEDAERDALLRELPDASARPLRALLRHPEDSAGALMDPDVLALPLELTVREAIERIRTTPETARYNVYVTDAEQRLVGVVNLREILIAAPRDRLEAIMHRDVHRLPADADRHAIVAHPGWRDVHALPVVDERDAYLGAIRYRTLRRIESELTPSRDDGTTARALGDLFATGSIGVLEALVGGRRGVGSRGDGA